MDFNVYQKLALNEADDLLYAVHGKLGVSMRWLASVIPEVARQQDLPEREAMRRILTLDEHKARKEVDRWYVEFA